VRYVISDLDEGTDTTKADHHHVYLKFEQSVCASVLYSHLRDLLMHCCAVIPYDGMRLKEAINRFINYCKRKGPNYISFDEGDRDLTASGSVNQQIIQLVKAGYRRNAIVEMLQCNPRKVDSFMELRPDAHDRIRMMSLFVHSNTGVGNTELVRRVLDACVKINPEVDIYYSFDMGTCSLPDMSTLCALCPVAFRHQVDIFG